jgi:signal transduction histidine kinase/CheY-like chemotaxis protein/HPt (histidine-containing phosphotransfer) domain-containing protein
MTAPRSLDWEAVSKHFSIWFITDLELVLTEVGPRLLAAMPELKDPGVMIDFFNIQRPSRINNTSDLLAQLDSLFLMSSKSGNYAIRGQMTRVKTDAGDQLLFLGAPWLKWVQTNAPQLELSMRDFPPHDAQLDQMFMISSEHLMIRDLEEVNKALHIARETAERAKEARTQFFNQMNHELRTPLNGLASAISLLANQALDADSVDLLNMAEKSAEHMVEVVNYALDSSAIESGNLTSPIEIFQIENLLSNVCSIVDARAKEKGLHLEYNIDPSLKINIESHKSDMQRVLLNLVINAIKFTDQGHVDIRVLPAAKIEEKLNIRFEISDTGAGIEPCDYENLFNPFWTLPPKVATTYECGTGLGLHMVKKIVETMGGEVGVSSQPGIGSTFWFQIPVVFSETKEPETIEQTDIRGIGNKLAGNLAGRILLVEDNMTNQKLMQLQIQAIAPSIVIDLASSGQEALDFMLNQQYELVLMDLNLPDLHGREVTLKANSALTQEPVVVALTAQSDETEQALCRDAGMRDFLIKPLSREQLSSVLAQYMRKGNADTESNTEGSLLDTGVLAALRRDIGDDMVRVVLSQFIDEVNERTAVFSSTDLENNREEVAAESHALASSCKSFGLVDVGQAFLDLETAIKSDRVFDLTDTIDRITIDLNNGLSELKNWMMMP